LRQVGHAQRLSAKGGEIRHFWGTELVHGPSDSGQDNRGLDLLNLIFAMFDVRPEDAVTGTPERPTVSKVVAVFPEGARKR